MGILRTYRQSGPEIVEPMERYVGLNQVKPKKYLNTVMAELPVSNTLTGMPEPREERRGLPTGECLGEQLGEASTEGDNGGGVMIMVSRVVNGGMVLESQEAHTHGFADGKHWDLTAHRGQTPRGISDSKSSCGTHLA